MTSSPTTPQLHRLSELVRQTQQLAEQLAKQPTPTTSDFITSAFAQLHELGLLSAALPSCLGGLGLGTEPGTHLALLQILSIIGGADLSLGRLFEGHVNALILATTFAEPQQLDSLAQAINAGQLMGVWNTGLPEPLRAIQQSDNLLLQGGKSFASGVTLIHRPIVTAELSSPERSGWQMILLDLHAPNLQPHLVIDRDSWSPLGMEASGSFTVSFTGAQVARAELLGQPGDFYRDPLFRGGAIRFAAVHAGAILRLLHLFTEWVNVGKRDADPYAIARLGELTLIGQSAIHWIESAAAHAEQGLSLNADKAAAEHMVAFANTMRLSVERLATSAINVVIPGVGARGLLRPHRFEQIIRDLTLYLRQPSPDQTLADVGQATLRNIRLHRPALPWTSDTQAASLSPAYFDDVYRASTDPWSFETSPYEAEKYAITVAALGGRTYNNALEIGCSIGVLTAKLAPHCRALLSVDVSEKALDLARKRLATAPYVRLERQQIPHDFPTGHFDLVVLSEVGYYWQLQELQDAATRIAEHQQPGSHLLLVHFTDIVPDYPLTGDQVHNTWLARPEWKSLHAERHPHFRLDLFERL